MIVVLGCKPSKALEARVRRGVALHRKLGWSVLMTGRGESGPMAEASGLPGSALILEDRATTTAENAARSAALVPGATILVVTQWWHLPRALRHFRAHFGSVRGEPVWEAHRGALREIAAWVLHLTHRA